MTVKRTKSVHSTQRASTKNRSEKSIDSSNTPKSSPSPSQSSSTAAVIKRKTSSFEHKQNAESNDAGSQAREFGGVFSAQSVLRPGNVGTSAKHPLCGLASSPHIRYASSQKSVPEGVSEVSSPTGPNNIEGKPFDEIKAKAELENTLDAYKNLEVDISGDGDIITVETPYRMNPESGALPDVSTVVENPGDPKGDFRSPAGKSVVGKASPDELEITLSNAAQSGLIHEHLGLDPNTPLEPHHVQAFANDTVGVDCSGFVTEQLHSSSQFEGIDSAPGRHDPYWGTSISTIEKSEDFEDMPQSPSEWRAMDVIGWAGDGQDVGHVVMVKEVQPHPTKEGVYRVTCVESYGGNGPAETTYLVDQEGNFFESNGSIAKQDLIMRRPVVQ